MKRNPSSACVLELPRESQGFRLSEGAHGLAVDWAASAGNTGEAVAGYCGRLGRKHGVRLAIFSAELAPLSGRLGPDWRAEVFLQIEERVLDARDAALSVRLLDFALCRRLQIRRHDEVLLTKWYVPNHVAESLHTDSTLVQDSDIGRFIRWKLAQLPPRT